MKQAWIETHAIFIVGELLHEVAISSGTGSRHDGDALQHRRHRHRLVLPDDALLGEAVEDFLALTLHIAEGKFGVDVVNYHRQAVLRAIVHAQAHHNLHIVANVAARHLLELRIEEPELVAPNYGFDFSHRRTCFWVLFKQLEVAVLVDAHIGGFSHHPAVHHTWVGQQSLDAVVELLQSDSVGRFTRALKGCVGNFCHV